MMENVRFGIVGSGYFGGGLAKVLSGLPHSEVKLVYGGTRAGKLAEELGCRQVLALEDMMNSSDIDAVIVATPSHLHRDPVILAAQAGKHVFCEKPTALSLIDCTDMVRACEKAHVQMMVGHSYYFIDGLLQVRRWVDEGVIGKPVAIHSERTGWESPQAVVSWKKNVETSGGHLFHHIHELDFLQTIMGPAIAICTAGGNLTHQGDGYGNEEDVLMLTLEFQGGAVGTMQYGSGFHWGEHFVKINGTKGAIRIDFKRSKIYLRKDGQESEHLLHRTETEDEERASFYRGMDGGIAYGKHNSEIASFLKGVMEAEMTTFRDCLLGCPIPGYLKSLFDGRAARSSIAAAEAAIISLKEKRWVQIGYN
ncbi:Gfo/Idh/MocA family protein [Paenibacillus cremeus]|uniref:Gfo/Idh/MocA family oxidoreductase n=1 Tax=Paenibacillus cremeus TaxID=2163881 RepID=A0A559K7D4_9BACL|nr:Gfo/Idh/MocA family oxidoreductase [Paenibacillus cremeus]TVY08041.1 Gfo/Idh/MocA family oxidoreductase [Paenibacillus cremeus]